MKQLVLILAFITLITTNAFGYQVRLGPRTYEIPEVIPDWQGQTGQVVCLHETDEFKISAWLGEEVAVIVFSRVGKGVDIIAVLPLADKAKYLVDPMFMATGVPSGKFELVEKLPTIEDFVKAGLMKTVSL